MIGGGFTAVDCVRSAVRLGAAEVQMVYRRGMDEMPSTPEEIHEAQIEGVGLVLLASPLEILKDDVGAVRALRCVRNRLGVPDASGRRRPMAIEGSEFEIECDIVIAAISQEPDLSWIDIDLELTRWGGIKVAPDTGMTSHQGLFAAGDRARCCKCHRGCGWRASRGRRGTSLPRWHRAAREDTRIFNTPRL